MTRNASLYAQYGDNSSFDSVDVGGTDTQGQLYIRYLNVVGKY